ncbi:sucraseferredoxin family protein [Tolypothrix sp. NIES-4075]|uniref:sucrase ferredoxin n=1 Tax=Tolypothrix sp. NIES-4075 TaxID=2005459 RepID=UPI000B5C223A|nr:sucrase ferredoxin [Tolypothrix sp. NIES-4075]GAX40675.1 sucraseferredoxin family protein [Tolypothrix sp. NIES-4075]
MTHLFCSDHSKEVGEDVIGSATNYQTYVLIECPPPWHSEALNSRWVPNSLKVLVEEVKRTKQPIRFLLIANNESHKIDHTTLLIYHQQEGLGNGYRKQEFKLPNIEQAAPTIRKWLSGSTPKYEVKTSATRDILVCTHGSHDMCCARYGNPFYYHADATISDLGLDEVRIWKSSHFGGHRFAPTAIDLPEGRYYGALDQESFKSILMRSGDINCLNKVYRGWGILPSAMQVLERELILRYGWDWFDYKVAGKIIKQSLDNCTIEAELTFEKPSGCLYTYQARLVKDEIKTKELKGSCNATKESVFAKYGVANLNLIASKVSAYCALPSR